MGLLKAFGTSVNSVLADQWKEYYYCDSLSADIIVMQGTKKTSQNSSNHYGNKNIISNGSIISVANGQCMIIVEQGKVIDLCAEPGEYIFDSSSESSIFEGNFDKNSIYEVFHNISKRFGFGGDSAKDQRIYYFNTKEITGNYYGTPSPIPFRVVDNNIGLDIDITIRCFGEYSYRITNPLLFYTNVCGNIDSPYLRELIDSQLKSELLTALQPAFAEVSKLGIRYSALPGHTEELASCLNKILSDKWKNTRGIEISSLGISSIKADEKDEKIIKELQRNATFKDPSMAAAQLIGAQSIAMQEAAKNQNAGPAMAFMGMNMASQVGSINAKDLFDIKNTNQNLNDKFDSKSEFSWKCSCGNISTGNFCSNCGAKRSISYVWTCKCGTENTGNFCSNCGSKKIVLKTYCDNCGWNSSDTNKFIKFCPQCGKQLNE